MSALAASSPRVDAHHHLWNYTAEEYGWIDDSMTELRRDFTTDDLVAAMAAAEVDYAIAVQARRSLEETEFLLHAAATPQIAGVVGWAPLTEPSLAATLDRFAGNDALVGLREIAQGQPRGFFDRPEFNRGIEELTRHGLVYDILIYENQLEEATRFVDRHPLQRFVLDHIAKPRIAAAEIEPWAAGLRELARRRNVACKLSGMVTEANWRSWTRADLDPYLDVCVEAFTPSRLMAGSDWPVCLVASAYERWWSVLHEYLGSFSADERAAIFGLNAIREYHLPVRTPQP